jgi:hypothetical protein
MMDAESETKKRKELLPAILGNAFRNPKITGEIT